MGKRLGRWSGTTRQVYLAVPRGVVIYPVVVDLRVKARALTETPTHVAVIRNDTPHHHRRRRSRRRRPSPSTVISRGHLRGSESLRKIGPN